MIVPSVSNTIIKKRINSTNSVLEKYYLLLLQIYFLYFFDRNKHILFQLSDCTFVVHNFMHIIDSLQNVQAFSNKNISFDKFCFYTLDILEYRVSFDIKYKELMFDIYKYTMYLNLHSIFLNDKISLFFFFVKEYRKYYSMNNSILHERLSFLKIKADLLLKKNKSKSKVKDLK